MYRDDLQIFLQIREPGGGRDHQRGAEERRRSHSPPQRKSRSSLSSHF